MKLCFVSSNKSKFKELQNFFERHVPQITIVQKEIDVPEIQSLDLKEVAAAKAIQAWNKVQEPVLIDDSGIFFDSFPQFPGTLSRYVYDALGFEGLLKLCEPGSSAEFRSCIVYCDGPQSLHIFSDACRGTICLPSEKFDKHFPYCSIFIPEGYTLPYSELQLTQEEDEYLNQRYKALKKLAGWLVREKIIVKHDFLCEHEL